MSRPASRMTRSARALTLVAALLLGALYFTPLWSVRLVAPQYPEGLGMLVRLNTIEGAKEHDLRNINSLNRYIGMKPIVPEAIPELRYMPWIAAGLIAAGVLVAALGRRRLLVGWIATFIALGAAGLYDFYRWGHDYGHNLDLEQAIIIVPDMTYQPPVIGTKQLLNFTATSMPGTGGVAAGAALLLGVIALFLSYRRSAARSAVIGSALVVTACGGDPRHLPVGIACVECRMIISDLRFGAVAVTSTGKQLHFDSVTCLLEYLRGHPESAPSGVWVANAASPGTLVRVADAAFVRDGALRAPMGDLVAYAASDLTARPGMTGTVLSWNEILTAEPAHAP